jgi:hypothetical protein
LLGELAWISHKLQLLTIFLAIVFYGLTWNKKKRHANNGYSACPAGHAPYPNRQTV